MFSVHFSSSPGRLGRCGWLAWSVGGLSRHGTGLMDGPAAAFEERAVSERLSVEDCMR
jgi:hypothetical protein